MKCCPAVCLVLLIWSAGPANSHEETVDFNRAIRPLLSDACFHCHGPDPGTREAELRLDQEDNAKEWAIIAGDANESELVRRIESSDPDLRMPPPDSGKSLTPEQIRLLRKWVQDGASWAEHWAFQPPVRESLDSLADQNPIDVFVTRRLVAEDLQLSSPADSGVLLRRLSLDLTGLPPSQRQMKRFVADPSSEVYAAIVDELLASPHFGERMAMEWLDAARYADSDGYQQDATRQNWPWRDWVVDAFNGNMPFDQFTIEQFAGDLLPDASPEQILATCFHRNHMHNGEGGRDPEESRIEYVIDRVNTMGTVWLGLTLGCAQCHSHKYDPISHAEYYQLNAFFNSIEEDGRAGGNAKPFLKYTSPYVAAGREDSRLWLEQQRERLAVVRSQQLQAFDHWLDATVETRLQASVQDFRSWRIPDLVGTRTTGGTELVFRNGEFTVRGIDPRHDDYIVTVNPPRKRLTGIRLTVLPSENKRGQLSRAGDGHFLLTNLKVRKRSADGSTETDLEIRKAVSDYPKKSGGGGYGPVTTVLDDDPRTGWSSSGRPSDEVRTACFEFQQAVNLKTGETLVVELRQRSLRGYSNLQRFRIELTDEAGAAPLTLGQTPFEKLAARVSDKGRDWRRDFPKPLFQDLQIQYLSQLHDYQVAVAAVAQAEKRTRQYDGEAKPRSVTVLKQRPESRTTHILKRGVWDAKGDVVTTATPAVISHANASTTNRLELAKWLVGRRHPLTARVVVNRYWQMLFGKGLVRTPGDFGTQGEPPTHPQLLDWLAVEFIESGWDVKHMLRLMVISKTYQQSSFATADLLERDPDNRFLGRANRFRMPSWMIRDVALSSSGLLDLRRGGPPVYPFQPIGAWMDATMGRFRYEPSVGSDRYRRSLYTFWRRSVAPTGLFDASPRRVCEVRTVRTNTPLHALTLLNDETFLEAARALAVASLDRPEVDMPPINSMFRRVLHREPTAIENRLLQRQYDRHLVEFERHPQGAERLLSVGQKKPAPPDVTKAAALMMVASTLLNLDEAMTRE